MLASLCAFTKYVQSYVTSCNIVEDNIVCGNICDLMYIGDRNLTRFCSNEINTYALLNFLYIFKLL